MGNARTFCTALKAMKSNFKNMGSKIYNFSKHIRVQYELYESIHKSKGRKALVLLLTCQKDTKEGDKEI